MKLIDFIKAINAHCLSILYLLHESVDFQWGTGRVNTAIVSYLAGYQSRERLRLIDARSSIAQAHILVRPAKKLGFGIFGMTVLSNKKTGGSCGWCLLI